MKKVSVFSHLSIFLLFLSTIIIGCGGGGGSKGGSGGGGETSKETIVVTAIDDSDIPTDVRNDINNNSGKIISRNESDYPSGKVVVIRVETSDYPQNEAADYNYILGIFFGSTQITNSLMQYFIGNSYSEFVIENGGIPDWVKLPDTLAFYGPVEGETFLENVLRSADVDWNAFDANNDDTLTRDEVTVVYLIPNADSALTYGIAQVRHIDPFDASTPNGKFTFDLPVVTFSLVEAGDPDPSTNPIRNLSSVAHELCHAFFDLPDRYSGTSGGMTYVTGTGPYDIMSNDRSWEMMTMYDRIKIGWISPKILAHHLGKTIKFFSSSNSQHALVLLKPAVTDPFIPSTDEMWIVENRNKSAVQHNFDAGLPESGLAIWWVRKGTWAGGHDEVRLVDYSKDDLTPTQYTDPGNAALFKYDSKKNIRYLWDTSEKWSLLYFLDVSIPGATMTVEF